MRFALRGFGISFVVWGLILSGQRLHITGFAFLEGWSPSTTSFFSLLFIAVGIVLISASRSNRFKTAGLAALVGLSQPTVRDEAHNATAYHALRESYAQRERTEQGLRHSESEAGRLHHMYGAPPREDDSDAWITFYHAYPEHRGFKLNEDSFVDEKKLKGGGFFFADNPHKAQEELPTLHPSEIAILRIKIARNVYDELAIEKQTSNFSDDAYKLSKSKAELANNLYRAGYIVVEEHGKKHIGRFRHAA